jgi:hypothetical protein
VRCNCLTVSISLALARTILHRAAGPAWSEPGVKRPNSGGVLDQTPLCGRYGGARLVAGGHGSALFLGGSITLVFLDPGPVGFLEANLIARILSVAGRPPQPLALLRRLVGS